ncbi:MAG: S-methyl-5'-thioinosine phosphorylase [Solirubrobacterales bacterium]
MLAVIGGTGLYSIEGLAVDDRRLIDTGYGEPSGEVITGHLGGDPLLFLARHGDDHSIAPHRINYRANLKALEAAGATRILAVGTVGGIDPGCQPGTLVVPDQLIDYTWGREHTFEGEDLAGLHVDFTWPYAVRWRSEALEALASSGVDPEMIIDGGTYAAVQGPRLETAAEVSKLAADGCAIVGMTGMPEAVLARELDLDYAAVCPVVNLAAGLTDAPLDIDSMGEVLERALVPLRDLIVRLA